MLNRLVNVIKFLRGDLVTISFGGKDEIQVDWGKARQNPSAKKVLAVQFFKTANNLS